jgi:hypothetical protein
MTLEITSISGYPPYDIYVCDIFGFNCEQVAILTGDVPPPVILDYLGTYENSPVVTIKIVDSSGCVTTELFYCVDPTPTPTPTLTPTPTPTQTKTPTPTRTPTKTPTNTPTNTQTPTVTPSGEICIYCPDGYTLINDECIAPPFSGSLGTTYTFVQGDQSINPAFGTLFYNNVTNLPKPFTSRNFANFNPSTSAVTIPTNQICEIVDGTGFDVNSNHSQVAQFFGYYDSNLAGTPLSIETTGTTSLWQNSLDSVFLKGSIKYETGLNQWVGGRFCLTAYTTQEIHIFLGADDLFSLKINGEWFFKRLNNNSFNQFGDCNPFNTIATDGVFGTNMGNYQLYQQYSHVFPITLTPGEYFFDYAFSDVFNYANEPSCSASCCTTATFEIYTGITTSILTGLTSYSELLDYTAFSTRETIGTPQTVFGDFGAELGIYCDLDAIMTGDCITPYCVREPLVTQGACPTPTPTPTPTSTVPCQCPIGYTATSDCVCIKITETGATSIDDYEVGDAAFVIEYGEKGFRIFDINDYNISGNSISGNYAYTGGTFIVDGQPTTPEELFWSQRMNNISVWVEGNISWPSFNNYPGTQSICASLEIENCGYYYFGIGSADDMSISINGELILDQPGQSPFAFPPIINSDNFMWWNIYPVYLNAGLNLITFSVTNRSSFGAIAAEIYGDTLQTLTAATSTSGLNILFTTDDFRTGGPLHNTYFCSDFECPDGYYLDVYDYKCKKIEDVPCFATPTGTPTQTPTNTETPTNTPTNTETPTQTPTLTPTPTPTSEPCYCPPDYETNEDKTKCFKIFTEPASVDESLIVTEAYENVEFGENGYLIYNINDYDAFGNSISTNYAHEGWSVNVTGIPNTPNIQFWTERMNQTAVWVSGFDFWPDPNYPDYVSLCKQINLYESKYYYFGIGANDDITVILDGVALVNQLGSGPPPFPPSVFDDNFKIWHIYPVFLNSGPHMIELKGFNRSSRGAFSFELYNSDINQLKVATNPLDLDIIYSTQDYRTAGPSHNVQFCSNYTCPSGSGYIYDPDEMVCKFISYLDCAQIPFPSPSLTPTQTISPTTTPTPTPTGFEVFTISVQDMDTVKIRQINTLAPLYIDWNDGNVDYFTIYNILDLATHTYSGIYKPYTGNIFIKSYDLSSILRFSTSISIGSGGTSSKMTIIGSELSKLDNLKEFYGVNSHFSGSTSELPRTLTQFISNTGKLTGDLSDIPTGLTLFNLNFYEENNLTGDVINLPRGLITSSVYGFNTITGDVNDLPTGLTTFRYWGQNTISGNTINLPRNLTIFNLAGSNTLEGSIGDLPTGLTQSTVYGHNSLSGDLSTLSARTFNTFQVDNSTLSPNFNTIEGDIKFLNRNIRTLLIGGNNTVSGNTKDLPTGFTPSNTISIEIRGFNTIEGGVSDISNDVRVLHIDGNNTISGNTSQLPTNANFVIIRGSNTLTGTLDTLPTNLTVLDIRGQSTITNYVGRTWVNNLNRFIVLPDNPATKLTDSSIDNLLIDFTGYTWVGEKRIELRGSGTSLSDDAKNYLTGATPGGLGINLILYN